MSHESTPKSLASPMLFELDAPSRSGVRALGRRVPLLVAPTPTAPKPKRKQTQDAAKRVKTIADGAARPRRPRRYIRYIFDRALLNVLAVLLVGSVSTLVVSQEPGVTHEAVMRKLTRAEMPALSPLLVTGDVRRSDDGQYLHGWISGTRWRALDPAERRSAAIDLARHLAAAGVETADLYDHSTLTVVIRDGAVVHAAGAAP